MIIYPEMALSVEDVTFSSIRVLQQWCIFDSAIWISSSIVQTACCVVTPLQPFMSTTDYTIITISTVDM